LKPIFVYSCEQKRFSHEAAKYAKRRERMNPEEASAVVVDTAFHLHRDLGPGLLESVYEAVLARMLEKQGVRVERQKTVTFDFDGIRFDEGLRVDLLVADCLIVELKSVENLAPVHAKQLLTYLRLLNLPLGLLINFGAATFKEGVKRIVNGHCDFGSSNLRVNRKETHTKPQRSRRSIEAFSRKSFFVPSCLGANRKGSHTKPRRTRRGGGFCETSALQQRRHKHVHPAIAHGGNRPAAVRG